MLYGSSAYLLEGRVEQDPRRGFSFVVDGIRDLADALKSAKPAGRRPAAERARRPA